MPFPVPHVGGYYDTSCSIHLAAPERMCYFLQLPSPASQPISCSVPSRVPGYTGNYSCSVLCRVPGYTRNQKFRSRKRILKEKHQISVRETIPKTKNGRAGPFRRGECVTFCNCRKMLFLCLGCTTRLVTTGLFLCLCSFCVCALFYSFIIVACTHQPRKT